MWRKDKNKDEIEMVVLRTTNNDQELNLIKEILEQNKIPYLMRNHGAGGHMRIIGGSSLYPADILVEKSTAKKAEGILDEFPWD